MPEILLVEDDPDIAALIRCNISDLGEEHTVTVVDNGLEGLEHALSGSYELLLLDIMLPGLHGTEICKRVREVDAHIPIVLLTARNSELDKVLGLELGADDYITKPFAVEELFARIKALQRRTAFRSAGVHSASETQYDYAELSINSGTREVYLASKRLELTPIEYDLLLFFAQRPGKAFSREEILDAIWGATESDNESVVNSHVNRLRKKLSADDEQRFIKTLWGVGYRFSKLDELQ